MSEGRAPEAGAPRRADLLSTIVATGLGSGYSPFAPGTAGSAVGLLLFWPLHSQPAAIQVAAVVILFFVGVVASTRVARGVGLEDPGIVVVDEVVGMWTSLLSCRSPRRPPIAGFVLFRIMDVFKPYPARAVRVAARRLGHHDGRPHGRHLREPAPSRRPPGPWDFDVYGIDGHESEILAVGSELLTPLRSDTNALYLTAKLLEVGIDTGARVTVADDAGLWSPRSATRCLAPTIVISTGGLGPTEDDLTREAAAAALGRPLHRDPALIEELKARFARFGRVMAAVNEKQADVIEGAVVLRNPRGTARPARRGGRAHARAPPGRPTRCSRCSRSRSCPVLAARAGGRALRTRILKIAAMGKATSSR
jgi:molybdopterin-biosynthesis enzyme MoeA-like protein/phosphatidylglycerophosphatase A